VYLFLNSAFHPVSAPIFTAANRAYRYGEGLFETMLYLHGRICFGKAHFERLINGMNLLGILPPPGFDLPFIEHIITQLVEKNGHYPQARIRLSVTCGEGILNKFDNNGFNLLIESFDTPVPPGQFNEAGWTIGLFTAARKTTDEIARYKTASHLVYALAARFAIKNDLNDCVVLNTAGNICDTSIANIFIIAGNKIITPPVNSGCIAGIMRGCLLNSMREKAYPVEERAILPQELETADELFITNVIQGIRWMGRYENKIYKNTICKEIGTNLVQPLYQQL
jgi:branched-chain amino acid aminotransferase